MDYEDLVKEIKSQGITKLPALLIVVAEQCVAEKVFQPGGMERVISRIASQPSVKANAQEQSCKVHELYYEKTLKCRKCGKTIRTA
ncbi:MAG: hypothetical protein ACFFDN_23035 [Candidatus Hodarchaeota archaeon]